MKHLNIYILGTCIFFFMAGCINQPTNNTDKIEINQKSDYTEVILKNQHITARYTSHNPSALVNLFINDLREDVAGGTIWKYLDGLETSGSIKYARMIEKKDSLETVELIWENLSESYVTIYNSLPLLKIDYYHTGSRKILDVGATRGNHNGHIATYGNKKPFSNDPESCIPVTDYKGYFIGGVFNFTTGIGFGRIFPFNGLSEDVKIIADSGGLEYIVTCDKNGSTPITSFLYTITKGEDEMITLGKAIVDWHLEKSNRFLSEKKIEPFNNWGI